MELLNKPVMWAALAATLAIATPSQAQTINAQDCYVSDANAGTDLDGLIFRIDESDGSRTVISDFNDTALGPRGMEPTGMALLNDDTLLVLDVSAGRQFRPVLMTVDVASGERTIVTDFGNPAQGPTGRYTSSIRILSDGTVLVTDGFSGTDLRGTLISVDINSGLRTLVSDFGDIRQGPLGQVPNSVIESSRGRILVLDQNSGANRGGALYSVNPANGKRRIVSDFNDAAQGPLAEDPTDMVELPSGDIYVIDFNGGTDRAGQILRILADGSREQVSDFGDAAQGIISEDPISIATDADGQLIVLDTRSPAMLSVNPATGQRTLVSDFNDAAQGVTGLSLIDVLIIGGEPGVVDSDGDSVPDENDQCPIADDAITVVIEGCDSGVDNVVLSNGCTISQSLAGAGGSATTTGEREQSRLEKKKTSSQTRLLRGLEQDGIISREEKTAIENCL